MKAYKGFTEEIKSIMGNGIAEKCTFFPGLTMEEKGSKTGREGFHCCEYIFDCMKYYPMDGKNRFFQVEAEGNLDEDDSGRISCTRITLVRELNEREIAMEGMLYLIGHPDRAGWECQHLGVQVGRDREEAEKAGDIAIARGTAPAVRGQEGSIAGLIREDPEGKIQNARMIKITREQQGCWLGITEGGEVIQI